MQAIFAQIDPTTAIDQLAAGAITGGAVWVLSAGIIAMGAALVWVVRALLAAKDALATCEKEHTKKVEELLKDSNKVMEEIRNRLIGAGGAK